VVGSLTKKRVPINKTIIRSSKCVASMSSCLLKLKIHI
jgi:hypothetical protein